MGPFPVIFEASVFGLTVLLAFVLGTFSGRRDISLVQALLLDEKAEKKDLLDRLQSITAPRTLSEIKEVRSDNPRVTPLTKEQVLENLFT